MKPADIWRWGGLYVQTLQRISSALSNSCSSTVSFLSTRLNDLLTRGPCWPNMFHTFTLFLLTPSGILGSTRSVEERSVESGCRTADRQTQALHKHLGTKKLPHKKINFRAFCCDAPWWPFLISENAEILQVQL